METRERWIITCIWDASSYASPPSLACFHVHGDGTEHSCEISPLSGSCEKSLIAGKCQPETVIKCSDCGKRMAAEDKIEFRP